MIRAIATFLLSSTVLIGQTLGMAPNAIRTVLTANVGLSGTSISVAVCSKITPGMVLNIDSELMTGLSVDYSTCVISVSRAIIGTAVARHYTNGIVSAYVADKNSPMLNVDICNSAGDGTTDDTAAFITCSTLAKATGKILTASGKTYAIKNWFTDMDATGTGDFSFQGQPGTTLKCLNSDGTTCVKFNWTTSTRGKLRLDGFAMNGPDAQSGPRTHTSGHAILLTSTAGNTPWVNMSHIVLNATAATGFYGTNAIGLWCDGCEDSSFQQVQFGGATIGMQGTVAFNGNVFNMVRFYKNVIGFNCPDCTSNVFNMTISESNEGAGLLVTGVGNVFLGFHLEANNTAATSGLCTLTVAAKGAGNALFNVFSGGQFSGTMDKVCFTNDLTGGLNSLNLIENVITSSMPLGANLGASAKRQSFLTSFNLANVTGADSTTTILNNPLDGANLMPDGSFSVPSSSFTADPTTGVYRAANGYHFAVGGVDKGVVTAGGWVSYDGFLTSAGIGKGLNICPTNCILNSPDWRIDERTFATFNDALVFNYKPISTNSAPFVITGSFVAGGVPTGTTTRHVAAFPPASITLQGMHLSADDSSVNTWGTVLVGGGAFIVDAFCNGVNWTISAK
jgi:hypothetical protein